MDERVENPTRCLVSVLEFGMYAWDRHGLEVSVDLVLLPGSPECFRHTIRNVAHWQ